MSNCTLNITYDCGDIFPRELFILLITYLPCYIKKRVRSYTNVGVLDKIILLESGQKFFSLQLF